MIKITVINVYPAESGHFADLIDPKAGRRRTIGPLHPNTTRAWRDRLSASGQWLVTPSLAVNGLWRAVDMAMMTQNCPDWAEQGRKNAEANRR